MLFQENYLSEHHYEETLDSEKAKTLLNFGDDYRNFLESNNSEVQSPRISEQWMLKRKRTSCQNKAAHHDKDKTDSDDEYVDLFIVIDDLKRDAQKHEEDYREFKLQGFEAKNIELRLVCVY